MPANNGDSAGQHAELIVATRGDGDRLLTNGGAQAALFGRRREGRALDGLVEAVQAGQSRVLVLRGEAGVGKSALLDYATEAASGCRVARVSGIESESQFAYAALHQLCAPALDLRDRLPAPQRDALEATLGLSAEPPPDRFVVGLAVLGLLSELAGERPLLCVVDDAQWLDDASARTLGFVARRLPAESAVALVFAVQDPAEQRELVGLPELRLEGLVAEDACALLATVTPGRIDERIRDRILAEARGNPLALLELARGMSAAQLAGGFELPRLGRVEESFLRRLEELPDETRLLLVLAAAEPLGEPALMWRAASRLGITGVALEPAVRAGMLHTGTRVHIRNPMARAAVYQSASALERRIVHRALADETDPELEPDHLAWHRAQATSAPDEDVAAELERSAARTQARGAIAAVAAFLGRAADLTVDPARRAERMLAAAQANLHAGAFDTALALLASAQVGPMGEFGRARLDLLRGHAAVGAEVGGDAPSFLLKAGRQLETLDLQLAREAYLTAWIAASTAPPSSGGSVRVEICRAVRALPPPVGAPRPLDLLLDGLACLTTKGHAGAVPSLQQAAGALATLRVEDVLRWGWVAAEASCLVWDVEGMHAIAARHVQVVRDAGAVAQLPRHLSQLALVTAFIGDLAGAASLVTETARVAAATDSRTTPYTALRLAAVRGNEVEFSGLMAGTVEQAAAGAQETAQIHASSAAAVLYNGLARYQETASAARHATERRLEPSLPVIWALPELVEAAARTGDTELAREAHERLADVTEHCSNDLAAGVEARCRALLSNGAVAEELYREAIDRLGRTRLRPELARAHLLFGEWLRREGRRVDARDQLRAAHEMLDAIGMEAFAERARRELVATGEKVRKRTVETRDDLTPQESQVAGLARDGLTNPEIGARLFLSPRTIEWHLRNVFNKLDIHSRRELANALPGPGLTDDTWDLAPRRAQA